ncbi:MAG: CHAT domain-containing protein [Cyanobacteria bacterium P01_F01_bin.86]
MTQEFHLSITSLGSDRYLIRTEDTAAGVPVAETQVEWPVENWLQLAQPAMDDPIMGLLKGQAEVGNTALGLHKLGKILYDALFHEGAIRESWLRAQGIAQNREEMLRLRLGLKESRLQRLPWEVLHHDGHPLTTRSDLTFTRYAANFLVGQTLDASSFLGNNDFLRVLMVIASPGDQDYLELAKEAEHIRELLDAENEATLPVKIEVLKQPDRSTLAQALEQGNYQVLHYAGHSDFGDSGGDLSLVNRQTGLTERLSGDDLAGLLVNNHVVLTVFNSCRSGHTAGDDVEMDWRQQNLVQALVNRGVPGVIAMAERIPDEVAIAFTQLFYKNLRKGYPIDLSLSRTRQGLISAFGSDQYYWALPILYLQPDFDGYLTSDDDEEAQVNDEEAQLGPKAPVSAASETPSTPTETLPQELPSENGTVDILKQLESSSPVEDEDEVVANFVRKLSETSKTSEDPPMPAAQEEVLVDNNSERARMAIYDTLPEVPLKEDTAAASALLADPQSPPSQNGDRPHNQPSQTQRFASPQSQQTSEQSLLIWFALGLVGLVAVFGLGALALRWANSLSESPPAPENEPSTASITAAGALDVDILIRQAEQAIEQGRYGDAREDFERALIQELIGNTTPNAATDAILPLISDPQQPDLAYIRGRIIWQSIALLGEDALSPDRLAQQRSLAAQAQDAWEAVDNTFMKGRIAQGFAHYATGDWDGAIESWEAAESLYEDQRQRQADPAASSATEPVILHAYAGLAMAHTKLANINVENLAEDEFAAELTTEERNLLENEVDRERAIARDYYQRLQTLDPDGSMSPEQLQIINNSEATWNNWFWTDGLLTDWGKVPNELEE